VQLSRTLTKFAVMALAGCLTAVGDPNARPERRSPTVPMQSSAPARTVLPRQADAHSEDSSDAGAPADSDAGMPQPTAASSRPPQMPASMDPHPVFTFVASGAAARLEDFSASVAARLDCPMVQIDSSSESPFEAWCGDAPTAKVVAQTLGPEVLVIPLLSLTIAADTTVRVTGERPVVFLVKGHVTIDGTLDGSAYGEEPGPGGDVMCGASVGGDAEGREGRNGNGGGGGAFGSPGGDGGDDRGVGSEVGYGGMLRGDAELVPLLGGCRGGHAGGCVGHPGAGGGAIQISASGSIVVRGTVAVDGAEGAAGCYLAAGGTGGGSGGALLFEAQTIDVLGATLRARGGRGGKGANGASGGEGALAAGEPGGAGGVLGFGAGGGGGGYGRIKLDGKTSCEGC